VRPGPSKPAPECGSVAAYQRHRRYGEPIDDACRTANSAATGVNKRRLAQRQKLEAVARHLATEAVRLGHPAGYDDLYARALREELAAAGGGTS
jgi:hypothetical protein